MTIAERMHRRMAELDITQERLAEMANTSQTTISNVLSGTTKKPRNLVELATALGVSPIWLQTGEGEINSNLVALIPENEIDDDDAIKF